MQHKLGIMEQICWRDGTIENNINLFQLQFESTDRDLPHKKCLLVKKSNWTIHYS